MRPLDHPPPRLVPRLPLDGLCLFPARLDVRREAELLHDVPDLVVVIPLVQAHPLRLFFGWFGPLGVLRDALEGGFDELHVVAVGPVDGQPYRDAFGLHQQAPLGPLLAAVGRVFPRLFPPRGAPWSCTRPSPARTSPAPPTRRSPSGPPPTWPETPLARPTVGSGHGRWTRGRTWWRPGPSTGNRCGARTGWRPCTPGRGYGAGRHRSDGCSCVRGSTGRWPPTGRRGCASRRGHHGHPCLHLSFRGARKASAVTPNSCSRPGVIRIGSKRPSEQEPAIFFATASCNATGTKKQTVPFQARSCPWKPSAIPCLFFSANCDFLSAIPCGW